MTFEQRLAKIRAGLEEAGFNLLVALHDGAHFIEKPDPVLVLAGFKAIGPTAAILDRDGALTLVVTPSWDAERAAEACPGASIVADDDVVDGIETVLGTGKNSRVGLAGLATLPYGVARRVKVLPGQLCSADHVVFGPARCKTDTELAHAREATRIAELGLARLLEIARPGITEDALAMELRWHSKSLGAEDNFALISSGPHNKAVAPSHGRTLKARDIIVCELTPSYRGQLAQICRTVVLGEASPILRDRYALVVRAMEAGFGAASPGQPMSTVCRAIDQVFETEGYAEFCRPPHIRRRGHGLGFGSIEPGDVARHNGIVLEPNMLFMIHPNQYLPETGYLLCGEPAVVTEHGAAALTARQASLTEIPL
jgi:Xaa-Pro dipeptidase